MSISNLCESAILLCADLVAAGAYRLAAGREALKRRLGRSPISEGGWIRASEKTPVNGGLAPFDHVKIYNRNTGSVMFAFAGCVCEQFTEYYWKAVTREEWRSARSRP